MTSWFYAPIKPFEAPSGPPKKRNREDAGIDDDMNPDEMPALKMSAVDPTVKDQILDEGGFFKEDKPVPMANTSGAGAVGGFDEDEEMEMAVSEDDVGLGYRHSEGMDSGYDEIKAFEAVRQGNHFKGKARRSLFNENNKGAVCASGEGKSAIASGNVYGAGALDPNQNRNLGAQAVQFSTGDAEPGSSGARDVSEGSKSFPGTPYPRRY